MKSLSLEHPVYIGFAGEAGSGKTSTANKIVPKVTQVLYGDFHNQEDKPSVFWDHYWLSAPLYETHAIRTQITGDDIEDVNDRMLYALHKVANDVMMERIKYEDLVELVYDLFSFPLIDPPDVKPRSFLQQVGDLFLKHDPDCFAEFVKHKIYRSWQSLQLEHERLDIQPPLYLAVISDVRRLSEAKMIKDRPQHFLIKFVADETTRRERLYDRDGMVLSDSQKAHHTETSIAKIPEEWYDAIVDTTSMTLDEQAEAVREIVLGKNNA